MFSPRDVLGAFCLRVLSDGNGDVEKQIHVDIIRHIQYDRARNFVPLSGTAEFAVQWRV